MGKIEKDNLAIAINILNSKNKKIYPACVSKQKWMREKQVTLFLISNGQGQPYVEVKKLSGLLRGITSKDDGDLYCLNCFILLKQKANLNYIKKYLKIKIFVML